MCTNTKAEKIAHGLSGLSVLAMLASAIVFFGKDQIMGLAGTQWILISIALGVFAVNMHACYRCGRQE